MAMFGVESFQAWGEMDMQRVAGEPDSLAKRLALLHRELLTRVGVSRNRAKKQYDKHVNLLEFKLGERVLLWSVKLNKEDGKKVVKPWVGPYRITARLGRVGYKLKAEVGGVVVRVHANRLRRIPQGVVETGDPEAGMFPDSLRTFARIAGTQIRKHTRTGNTERHFKVRISGKNFSCWTPESDLPEAVVKLYDNWEREGRYGTGVTDARRSGDRDLSDAGEEDVLFVDARGRIEESTRSEGENVAAVVETSSRKEQSGNVRCEERRVDWQDGQAGWKDRLG